MGGRISTISIFIVCTLLGMGCRRNEYKDLDCSTINSGFNADIRPILNNNCIASGCHNAGSGNGDFTTYAGVKAKVDNGSMEEQVLVKKKMPESSPLSLDLRKQIKCWINNGAPNN